MGECMLENVSSFNFHGYPKNKTFPTTFGENMEAFFGYQNAVNAELDYFDQILQEHNNLERTNFFESLDFSKLNKSSTPLDKEMPAKEELNLPKASCRLLQRLQDKKVNLLLVATSLNGNDVVQKLKSSLSTKTSSMIQLSFNDENNNMSGSCQFASNQKHSDLSTNYSENDTNINEKSLTTDQKVNSPKRIGGQDKDERYWKRRSSNNEAAKRSREAKRARFIWIQQRSKELEEENASLRKELKNLEQQVLEREGKIRR